MDPSSETALARLAALTSDLPEAPDRHVLEPVAEAVRAAASAGASPDEIAVAGCLSVAWVGVLLGNGPSPSDDDGRHEDHREQHEVGPGVHVVRHPADEPAREDDPQDGSDRQADEG